MTDNFLLAEKQLKQANCERKCCIEQLKSERITNPFAEDVENPKKSKRRKILIDDNANNTRTNNNENIFKSLDFDDNINIKIKNNINDKKEEIIKNIKIQMNDEIDTFDESSLKKLSYFNAMLSKRWNNNNNNNNNNSNNNSNIKNIITIDNLDFGLNELKTLLKIKKNGKINLNENNPFTFDFFEKLLNCDEYLSIGKIINKIILKKFIKYNLNKLNNKLINKIKNKSKYNKLKNSLNEILNENKKLNIKFDKNNQKRIKLDNFPDVHDLDALNENFIVALSWVKEQMLSLYLNVYN